tara:strand:+ start:783 stop:2072 length:1290 start_codon:yes stop_codon:yes gene_type:complete
MTRKTKRRTGRKSRRSIKRSIKRDLESSLRKKSLNKFNKRINKRKKKKTKKKKIQRGGTENVSEQTRNLQRSLESVERAQELSAARANLRSGQETGQTVEVPAGAGAFPESTGPAAGQVLEPAAAPVAAASTTTAGTDAPEEECKLPEKVAKLSRKLEECEKGKQANIDALQKAKAEAGEAAAARDIALEKVAQTEDALRESKEKIRQLEAELDRASVELKAAAEGTARLRQEAQAGEQMFIGQLEAELARKAELESKLVEAQEEVAQAEVRVENAERAQEEAQEGAHARDAELEEQIEALNKQIESLLQSKACSTIAEIIIDLKLIEEEAAASGEAEPVLQGDKYGLNDRTPLKYIKLAVRSIAQALGYGDEVTQLYEDELNDARAGDREPANTEIQKLLLHIYDNNRKLAGAIIGKIPIELGIEDNE